MAGSVVLMGVLFMATGLVMLRGSPRWLGPAVRRRIVAVARLFFGLAGLLLALFSLTDPGLGFPKRYSREFVIIAGFVAAAFIGTAGIVGLLGRKSK